VSKNVDTVVQKNIKDDSSEILNCEMTN